MLKNLEKHVGIGLLVLVGLLVVLVACMAYKLCRIEHTLRYEYLNDDAIAMEELRVELLGKLDDLKTQIEQR